MQHARNRKEWSGICLVLIALLAGLLLTGAEVASAGVPTTPTALTPAGHVVQVRPSFSWSKSDGSRTMEIRVFRGTQLILRRTGITTRPWNCDRSLPTFAGLSWKTRGVNRWATGRWSPLTRFRIEPINLALAQQWWGGGTATWCQMHLNRDGTFTRWLDAPFAGANGMFFREGRWAVSGHTIRISHYTETWEPTPMDASGVAPYTDEPLANCEWTCTLAADGLSLNIFDEKGNVVSFWRYPYQR